MERNSLHSSRGRERGGALDLSLALPFLFSYFKLNSVGSSSHPTVIVHGPKATKEQKTGAKENFERVVARLWQPLRLAWLLWMRE